MRHPHGYQRVWDAEGRLTERDTFKCWHCQRIEEVPPGTSPYEVGGYCSSCDHLICKRCAAKRRCRPFELALERAEARSRFHQDMEQPSL